MKQNSLIRHPGFTQNIEMDAVALRSVYEVFCNAWSAQAQATKNARIGTLSQVSSCATQREWRHSAKACVISGTLRDKTSGSNRAMAVGKPSACSASWLNSCN